VYVSQAQQCRAHDTLEFHVTELALPSCIPEGRLEDFEHDSWRTTPGGWDAVYLLSDCWNALEKLVHDHLMLKLWPSVPDVIVAGLFYDEDLLLGSRVDSDPYVGLAEGFDKKVSKAVFSNELGALAHLKGCSDHCKGWRCSVGRGSECVT
jgi:hypothetical protein